MGTVARISRFPLHPMIKVERSGKIARWLKVSCIFQLLCLPDMATYLLGFKAIITCYCICTDTLFWGDSDHSLGFLCYLFCIGICPSGNDPFVLSKMQLTTTPLEGGLDDELHTPDYLYLKLTRPGPPGSLVTSLGLDWGERKC